MAEKPIDVARARWGNAEVLDGGNKSGESALDLSSAFGRRLVQGVIDEHGLVRSRSFSDIHYTLTITYGMTHLLDETRPMNGGEIHFYVRQDVLVRIKTNGSSARSTPHMTISLVSENKSDWGSERAKFSKSGKLSPAQLVGRRSRNPPALSVIKNRLTHDMQDDWAGSCHFNFPDDWQRN